MTADTDVAVVGSGPNGLAAAVVMARAGLRVTVYEAAETLGGGCRSASLFDSETVHDTCAAAHPLAMASRFFREFDLAARGVVFDVPEVSYGHPLPGRDAGIAYLDLARTCERLGADGRAWRALMAPLVRHTEAVVATLNSELRRPPASVPAALALANGVLRHGTPLARHQFGGDIAPALLAGVAAHSISALPSLPGGALAMLLGHLAHAGGWPVVRGGSGRIVDALVADLEAHGGSTHTGAPIGDLRELGGARAVLLDVVPEGLLRIAGPALPGPYARALRAYRYGPGAAKVDYLVSEPIPWSDPELGKAGTVHLGGDQRATFAAERAAVAGRRPAEPFVLLAQQYAADPTRGRPGAYPVWAYCHLPNGDPSDPTETITRAIERYAPGFADTVLHSRGVPAAQQARYNANYVGGDIAAGAVNIRQGVLRPVARWDPYRTPLPGVYLCSAATPPGAGVHGMCGYLAARSALRHEFGITAMPGLSPARV